VPLWVHPDTISWLGLLCAALSALLTCCGPERWLYGLMGLLWMTYSVFDNMDGKQARRSGKSSRGGEFLDHAVDSVVVALSTFVWRHTLAFSQPQRWQSFLVLFAAQVPIFLGNWGHHVLGRILLGPVVEGTDYYTVDEFNFLYMPGICFVRGFLPFIWELRLPLPPRPLLSWLVAHEMLPLSEGQPSLTMGYFFVILMLLFCLVSAVRVLRALLALGGARHVHLLLPLVGYGTMVLYCGFSPLRMVWVFALMCCEVIADRLGIHKNYMWPWWPIAVGGLLSFAVPQSSPLCSTQVALPGVSVSVSVCDAIDLTMLGIMVAVMALYRELVNRHKKAKQ